MLAKILHTFLFWFSYIAVLFKSIRARLLKDLIQRKPGTESFVAQSAFDLNKRITSSRHSTVPLRKVLSEGTEGDNYDCIPPKTRRPKKDLH